MKRIKEKDFKIAGIDNFKYRPRLKIFATPNRKVSFDPYTEIALSYGYWQLVKRIKGKLVFNNYRYSNTTSGHQQTIRCFLKFNHIKIDYIVSCPRGLQYFESDSLKHLYVGLYELELKINNPHAKRYIKGNQVLYKHIEKQIKMCKSLGAFISKDCLLTIKNEVQMREHRRLEVNKEKYKKQQEIKKRHDLILKSTLNSIPQVNILFSS